MKRSAAAALLILANLTVCGNGARADAVTDDVPALSASETRDLESKAAAGDIEAARQLYTREGPELHRAFWLEFTARHGDCDAMEDAVDYYAHRSNSVAMSWLRAADRKGCERWAIRHMNFYASSHASLVRLAQCGNRKAVREVESVAAKLGVSAGAWIVIDPRPSC
jgi:hypothetical protein